VLEYLILDHNLLVDVEEVLVLSSLTTLLLKQNYILSVCLTKLVNLMHIYLNENKLSFFSFFELSGAGKTTKVGIESERVIVVTDKFDLTSNLSYLSVLFCPTKLWN